MKFYVETGDPRDPQLVPIEAHRLVVMPDDWDGNEFSPSGKMTVELETHTIRATAAGFGDSVAVYPHVSNAVSVGAVER